MTAATAEIREPPGRDWLRGALFVLVLLVAAGLRFWRITDCGLSSWDEYDYIRSGHWIATLGREGGPHAPDVAPAFFPFWLALCFLVAGFHDFVAIAGSALANLGTVVAVYRLGSRFYGPWAGLFASALMSANLFNLIYSHQAITDATFQLFFVLSVHALFVYLSGGAKRWLLLSGLMLGICENVKYHGFLAWCIVACWLLLGGARASLPRATAAKRLASSGALAFTLVLPWWLIVSMNWGLIRLVRHYLDYTLGAGGQRGTPVHLWSYLALWCGPAFLAAAALGVLSIPWRRRQADGVLILWLLVFSVGSLFYFAYPRLLLPITASMALLAGGGVEDIARRYRRNWLPAALCVVALVVETTHAWGRFGPYGAGYRAAGSFLATGVSENAGLATVTQPVLWHYYGRPLPDLLDSALHERLTKGQPVVFATDLTLRWQRSRSLFERNRGRVALLRAFDNPLSEPDILSTIGPAEFARYRRSPRDPAWDDVRQIRIYRVTGPWDLEQGGR